MSFKDARPIQERSDQLHDSLIPMLSLISSRFCSTLPCMHAAEKFRWKSDWDCFSVALLHAQLTIARNAELLPGFCKPPPAVVHAVTLRLF